jgi:hypothetical protein
MQKNQSRALEQHIEIKQEVPSIISKECSKLWIGDVAVHLEWIEVVGEIDSADGQTDGVLRPHIQVL